MAGFSTRKTYLEVIAPVIGNSPQLLSLADCYWSIPGARTRASEYEAVPERAVLTVTEGRSAIAMSPVAWTVPVTSMEKCWELGREGNKMCSAVVPVDKVFEGYRRRLLSVAHLQATLSNNA